MAVTASGLYVKTFLDMHDGTDLNVDVINEAIKYALFTNTITPNFSTDTAYGVAPYNANEVSGTGYTAGGVTLGTKTYTESPTGTVMFDSADPSWSSATFSGARCGVGWDDTATVVADCALWLCNFGADFAVSSGTLTVLVASTGHYTLDLTP